MKYTIILAFLFLSSCVDITINRTIDKNDYYVQYAENDFEIYRNNDRTRMNGRYQVLVDNYVKESFEVKNGLLVDKYTTYYPNGVRATESSYKNGRVHGIEQIFYPSGALKTQNSYTKGVKDEVSTSYFENGNIQSEKDANGTTTYNMDGGVLYKSSAKNTQLFEQDMLKIEEYEYDHSSGPIHVLKRYHDDGSIKTMIGFRFDEDYSQENLALLILNKKHQITDSISLKDDREKFMNTLKTVSPELLKGAPF